MQRVMPVLSAGLLLAALLVGPGAATASADGTFVATGFLCYPQGTIPGGPSTTLSYVSIDFATPANSLLVCYFLGTPLSSSYGGPCRYANGTIVVDFRQRALQGDGRSAARLTCWDGAISAKADLAITKTDNVTTAVPGTQTTYTIAVSNTGPSGVSAAAVSDPLPAGVSGFSWSATNGHSGTGAISDTVDLAVNATITYIVTASISPSATGNLVNTATVAAGANTIDTNPANNSATDTDTLTPMADLGVTISNGVTQVPTNSTSTYTVIVTNNGPSTATGTKINFAYKIPCCLTGLSTTTVGTLAPGQTFTTTLTKSSGPDPGTATHNATVSSDVPDPNPANNSETDSDTVV